MDLDDLEHNTRDGLHIASLAGTWIARGRRLRRHARPRRHAQLRAAAAAGAHAARVPPRVPRAPAAGRGRPPRRRPTRCSTARRSRSPTTASGRSSLPSARSFARSPGRRRSRLRSSRPGASRCRIATCPNRRPAETSAIHPPAGDAPRSVRGAVARRRSARQMEGDGRDDDLGQRAQGAAQSRRGAVVQAALPPVTHDDLRQDHRQRQARGPGGAVTRCS